MVPTKKKDISRGKNISRKIPGNTLEIIDNPTEKLSMAN